MPRRIGFQTHQRQNFCASVLCGVLYGLALTLGGCANKPTVSQSARAQANFSCQGSHTNGKKDGTWECRHENGIRRSRITYVEDVKNGPVELWFEDGTPDSYGDWKDGHLNGAFRSYHRNGQLNFESTYANGVLNGTMKEWDEEGHLLMEGEYKTGSRNGRLREWHKNGRLKSEGIYENNKLLRPEFVWDEKGELISPIK